NASSGVRHTGDLRIGENFLYVFKAPLTRRNRGASGRQTGVAGRHRCGLRAPRRASTACPQRRSAGLGGLLRLLHEFTLEGNVDLVADDELAVEDWIERHAEVFAVD